jgi:DNA polymerase-3 subunit gamma/tau
MSAEKSEKQEEYRVLARKYRPQNFDDLIGQDALVRTLKNAIESGRIAHAFMLTGIRGVGKTTTARIIAKALNYTGADGAAGPTTGDTSDCSICQAIAEDRHPDVMEMDAASRTGIDDIREILDGVRYAPTSARYKVYIIDEVHMLSKAAFNALLKTLEEPPEHVKFIFATTEIRKVPITVLSRCQRFDLRRIEPDVLQNYYGQIAEKENVKAEDEALELISRAADGSVRDGLSLLDQSIALGDGTVTAEQVKDMLGLADRALILDLLENALKGQSAEALAIMDDLYKKGADPIVVMQDMLDLSHQLTKHRALPQSPNDTALPKGEQERLSNLADALSMPTLGRTWQILLKGLGEVNMAPNPQKAAEMVVIRLLYAAELPDPAELVKKLKDQPQGASSSAPTMQAPAGNSSDGATIQADQTPQPTAMAVGETVAKLNPETNISDHGPDNIKTMQDVVNMLEKNGEMVLATHISMYAHPVKIEQGLIEFRAAENAPPRLSQDLSQKMKAITDKRWIVTVTETQMGEPTLAQLRDKAEEELRAHVMEQPLIKNILEFFPDAQLKEITKK